MHEKILISSYDERVTELLNYESSGNQQNEYRRVDRKASVTWVWRFAKKSEHIFNLRDGLNGSF
jgi:hypothetical protein